MIDDKRNAEAYLETCALGYAASVDAAMVGSVLIRGEGLAAHDGARAVLHDAGVRLAAALGNLDAAERAELTELRRLREGIEGLRGEVAAGKTALGEPANRALVVETIDALLLFASPNHTLAKEPAR